METIKKHILYPGRSINKSNITNPVLLNRLETIKKDGFIVLENFIPKEQLEYLQNTIKKILEDTLSFETPSIAQTRIDPIKHKEIIDNYFRHTLKEWEEFGITFSKSEMKSYSQVLQDFKPSTLKWYVMKEKPFIDLWLNPELLEIVESYMGLRPYLQEAYLRRNFPASYKVMNHFWHRDTNHPDYLLKVFFFFTDCNVENGPHEYVLGSVQDRTLDGRPYYSDSEIDSLYPPNSEKRVKSVVKAGTVVIEDTRGLHRAVIPEVGYRDLGFAVFLPKSFFTRDSEPLYKISQSDFKTLSQIQKSYIPKECIDE